MKRNNPAPTSSRISRRSFFGSATVAAAGLAAFAGRASVSAAESNAAPADVVPMNFPPDFRWGVAASAYQVEGATSEDGRGPCIWDTFCKVPGNIQNGDNANVACDQYHRYEEDVKSMAELGVKHYRFSISWSRILPSGRGQVNEKGVDYYRRLVDTLLKHGIQPHATLYHWDLPQALQDRYAGWQSREVANDFGDYTTVVVKRLGDRIKQWMTLNEIASFCYYNGYGVGHPGNHAPGIALKSNQERWQVVHHALLAHGTACQAIRAASPGACQVAVAENYQSFVPIIETPENITAARRAFTRGFLNGCILMPLLTGRYDEGWLADHQAEVPDIAEGDMKIIGQPLDALGANCYSGTYVEAANNACGYKVLPMFPNYPKGNIVWLNLLPESIYWAIRMVGEAAGRPQLPVFISENGCADGNIANAQGQVLDTDRVMFLRTYLQQLQRAIAEGHPVAGYFTWSLLDNFEWANGYSKRFGLMHVDFQSLKRTPKLGYHWYQQLQREGILC